VPIGEPVFAPAIEAQSPTLNRPATRGLSLGDMEGARPRPELAICQAGGAVGRSRAAIKSANRPGDRRAPQIRGDPTVRRPGLASASSSWAALSCRVDDRIDRPGHWPDPIRLHPSRVLDNEGLRGLLIASAPDVATLPRHSLADDLPAIMRASGEEARAEPAAAGRKGPESKEHRQSVTSSPTPIVLWQASARHLGGWG
jgi:hypothetical protein